MYVWVVVLTPYSRFFQIVLFGFVVVIVVDIFRMCIQFLEYPEKNSTCRSIQVLIYVNGAYILYRRQICFFFPYISTYWRCRCSCCYFCTNETLNFQSILWPFIRSQFFALTLNKRTRTHIYRIFIAHESTYDFNGQQPSRKARHFQKHLDLYFMPFIMLCHSFLTCARTFSSPKVGKGTNENA